MQTISINFIVPQGWHELADKQLRYVYQLLAADYATDEVKTLCLLQWSGTKVIGRQESGAYLLKKGKILFEVTPLTLAELLPHLDWLGSIPTVPVRLSKINRQHALPADFSEVPFETFIICDNLYQGYLQTQNDELLDQLGATLYGKSMDFKPYERINIFYWFAALKEWLGNKYSDFFQPMEAATGGNLLRAPSMNVEVAMNAQFRALTKGDITKEAEVLALGSKPQPQVPMCGAPMHLLHSGRLTTASVIPSCLRLRARAGRLTVYGKPTTKSLSLHNIPLAK